MMEVSVSNGGWMYAALFAGGAFAGVLNVLAGGGSFLTVPLLIEAGLPPTVANGTNRLGVMLQSLTAAHGFRRHGVLDARFALRAALPAGAGAIVGTWLALVISDQAFRRVLAFVMIGVTLWTLWQPHPGAGARRPTPTWLLAFGLFAVGVYGGFVQAGVGFLILALTTAAGFDLVRGNAIKVLLVALFTALSLAAFVWNGMVVWTPGLVLAAGLVVGGQVGVRLTILKGHAWVRGVVTVAVLVLAIRLLLTA
jgi:uncharacterized membrane protein YfcA